MARKRPVPLRIIVVALFFVLTVSSAIASATWVWAFRGDHEVTFESRESRTVDGAPVFNRVRYVGEAGRDVWLMQQSHAGRDGLDRGADRLAIVVDRSAAKARFWQFEPGPLGEDRIPNRIPGASSTHSTLPPPRLEREYSVSCGLCHANGPRALRPDWDSDRAPLRLRDALLVTLWNARVALSGKIENDDGGTFGERAEARRVPFAPRSSAWDEPLRVPSCAPCHGGTGVFARAPLLRRHFLSIGFLTREGAMPPPLHRLKPEDRDSLDAFLGEFDAR